MAKTIEQWKDEKKTPDWLFAAAKASIPGWGIGREVEEAVYDKCIAKTGDHRYHAHPPTAAAAVSPPVEAAEEASPADDATPLKGSPVIDDRPAKKK